MRNASVAVVLAVSFAVLFRAAPAAAEEPKESECIASEWKPPSGGGDPAEAAVLEAMNAERRASLKKDEILAKERARDGAEGTRDAAVAAAAASDAATVRERLVQATRELAAAEEELARAKLDAECAKLHSEVMSANARLLAIWRYGYGFAMSAAGGTGGANRIGGSVRFIWRIGPSYELETGARFDGFNARRAGNRRDFAAGAFGRVGFGSSNVGVFLGVSPTVVDQNDGAQPYLVGQLGGRLRIGDTVDAGSGSATTFFDARVFIEPWIALAGAPVAVLFGLELGGGIATTRWRGPAHQWKLGPQGGAP